MLPRPVPVLALALALASGLFGVLPAGSAAGLRPSGIELEPRLFGINLLRFSPTRETTLLEQYFRKNILKHRELTGAYLATVEHFRTKVLRDLPDAKARKLVVQWLDKLAEDHSDLGPGLAAARLFTEWAYALGSGDTLPPAERAELAAQVEKALGAAKVSPWTLLVAGLVSQSIEADPGRTAGGVSPAEELWDRASAAAPNEDSHLHFVLADLYGQTLDRAQVAVYCKKVATEFEKALLVSPGDKQLYTAVAGRYHELYEALSVDHKQLPFWFEELVFKRVIAVEPTNAQAHNNLSFLYSQYGVNLKDALKEAQIANQLSPNEPNFTDTLGWAYYKLGNVPRAIEMFEKAVALDPKLADAHFHLATAYYDLKVHEKAIHHFRIAVERDPGNAFALNNLAYLFAERNLHLEEGLDLVRRALKLEPENAAFLDTLGWLHYRLGQFEEAARWVGKALELQPEVSELHLHQGQIALARARPELALDHFEKALTYDPKNPGLARSLSKIYALEALQAGLARFGRLSAAGADKRNVEVFYRAMAEIHELDGDYDEAARVLLKFQALPRTQATTAAGPASAAVAPGTTAPTPSELKAALASLPPATEVAFTVEHAGLVKVAEAVIENLRTPVSLEPFREMILARLPRRLALGISGLSRPGTDAGLVLLVQLEPGLAKDYASRLAQMGDAALQIPGSETRIQLRSGAYKGRVLGELVLPGLLLHYTMLDSGLALGLSKSALVELVDLGLSAAPSFVSSASFGDFAVQVGPGDDALLIASAPALASAAKGGQLAPEEAGLLARLELIASRYTVDAARDALVENSTLYPLAGRSLAEDAPLAEKLARNAVVRFPAAERLSIDATFALVADRIKGQLVLKNLRAWVRDLMDRAGQMGLELPDLDLGGAGSPPPPTGTPRPDVPHDPDLDELEEDEAPIPMPDDGEGPDDPDTHDP